MAARWDDGGDLVVAIVAALWTVRDMAGRAAGEGLSGYARGSWFNCDQDVWTMAIVVARRGAIAAGHSPRAPASVSMTLTELPGSPVSSAWRSRR
jgi:hypothetical protein